MSLKKQVSVCGAILIGLIAFKAFTFEAPEQKDTLIVRFGEIKQVIVNEATPELKETVEKDPRFKGVKINEGAGLKFRLPFFDKIISYDHRYTTLDTSTREVITNDKKKILLDNNAQWRISNPLLFHTSIGSFSSADTRIDDLMYSKFNELIGRTVAHELISNREVTESITTQVESSVNETLHTYGISVLDVRIKRTDFPTENHTNIYKRMNAEREQMAAQYRSEGESEKTKIKSEADSNARILVANAELEAKMKRAQAEADAARIYNEAYNLDAEFYEFYQAIQTYKTTIDENTTLIIDQSSPFAKFFFNK